MFTSKVCNKRIDKVHKRWLSSILRDHDLSFYYMLSTLNETIIHQCCMNVMLTKVCKYLKAVSPELINEVFYLRQNH